MPPAHVTTVAAHLASICWFDPREGAVAEVSRLGASDATGVRMPDGTIRVSYFQGWMRCNILPHVHVHVHVSDVAAWRSHPDFHVLR